MEIDTTSFLHFNFLNEAMHLCFFFKYIFLLTWRITFVGAELAPNESKQGIIRNRLAFFPLFLLLRSGSSVSRCAPGREGGKRPAGSVPGCGGPAAWLARGGRGVLQRGEAGAGQTPGLIPAASRLPAGRHTAPLRFPPGVTASPGPRARTPLSAAGGKA